MLASSTNLPSLGFKYYLLFYKTLKTSFIEKYKKHVCVYPSIDM